jgi:hypothetical protein
MSITSKRYAVLGWSVWQVGKRTARYKAKQALKSQDGGSSSSSKRPGKKTGAIVSAAAAAGGALWFWRRRNGSEAESSG